MNRNTKIIISVITAGLLMLVAGFGIILYGATSAEDSGVAACKQIVEDVKNQANSSTDTSASSEKMTEEQRLEKRKPYEDSQYADLQSAGTGFVDAVYKVDNLLNQEPLSDDASLETAGEELGTAIGSTTLLTTQYGLLRHACANHGVELPSL